MKVIKDEKRARARELLRLGQLWVEKCELTEGRRTFLEALKTAESSGSVDEAMDSLAALIRLAVEAQEPEEVTRWQREIDLLSKKYPKKGRARVAYCRGMVAFHQNSLEAAQKELHRVVRVSKEGDLELRAKAWYGLVYLWIRRGRHRRAEYVAHTILKHFGESRIRGVNGYLHLAMGRIFESRGDLKTARAWYDKAYAAYLAERNWYHHLYVLLAYARLSRLERDLPKATWYLGVIERATESEQFTLLRKDVLAEQERLGSDAVDLLIDSRRGVVQTREAGKIQLGKQFILLHLLEALGKASPKGISKAEIIQAVWRERYRPEAHDNKLYYNINRLRKLIEPDFRKPKYLMNWQEGYRLAPGLRIQWVREDFEEEKR